MLNTTFANRYKILKKLGVGGFATVYLAKDTKTGIEVAIKIYNQLDTYGMQIFQQEYAKIAHVTHHRLLKAEHFDSYEDQPFLVMPYCKEGSLTKHLVSQKQDLSEEHIAKIIFQIAEGLEYLHKKGIVHRDLKPDNVLYKDADDLVISDFGVSQRLNSTLSKSVKATAKQAFGGYTPQYAPPEREVIKTHADRSFDVFSLGVLIYELATKTLPFSNTGKAIELGEPIPDLPIKYSKRLTTLVTRCLQKDPEKRPTAGQLKKWVVHFLEQNHWPKALEGNTQKSPNPITRIKVKSSNIGTSKIKPPLKQLILIVAVLIVSGLGIWSFWPKNEDDTPPDSISKERTNQEVTDTDKTDWANAVTVNSVDAYKEYLNDHPQGDYVGQANAKINELETLAKDEADWQEAIEINTLASYRTYISHHPNGSKLVEAKEKIKGVQSASISINEVKHSTTGNASESRNENNEIVKALEANKAARVNNPKDVNLIINEAKLYYKLGDKDKFKSLMVEAVNVRPDNPDLHYNIGVINMEQGNIEEARVSFRKAIEINPRYTNAQLNLSTTYLREGNGLIDEMNSLGFSRADIARYDELKQQRFDLNKEGAKVLEDALKTNPDNQQLLLQLKMINGALGDN